MTEKRILMADAHSRCVLQRSRQMTGFLRRYLFHFTASPLDIRDREIERKIKKGRKREGQSGRERQ